MKEFLRSFLLSLLWRPPALIRRARKAQRRRFWRPTWEWPKCLNWIWTHVCAFVLDIVAADFVLLKKTSSPCSLPQKTAGDQPLLPTLGLHACSFAIRNSWTLSSYLALCWQASLFACYCLHVIRELFGCVLYPEAVRRTAKWLSLDKLTESHVLCSTHGSCHPGIEKKNQIYIDINCKTVCDESNDTWFYSWWRSEHLLRLQSRNENTASQCFASRSEITSDWIKVTKLLPDCADKAVSLSQRSKSHLHCKKLRKWWIILVNICSNQCCRNTN